MGADEEEGNKEEEKQLHCISEDADQCDIWHPTICQSFSSHR